MKTAEFDAFFRKNVRKVFEEKKTIVDIGGGLRIRHSNRFNPENTWIMDLLPHVEYKVLDKVPDFDPDIVGDIHHLPFQNESMDAVICMSVLEHVEEPQKAAKEIYRVLKPGGYAFMYAPFLFYYHAEGGYYKDFYRFTKDGMEYLLRDFKTVELNPVRGPLETSLNLFPFLSKRSGFVAALDRWLRPNSPQVSGYNAFCIK